MKFAACWTAVVAAAPALAGPVEVLYTKITGHPTAVIPGARDLAGSLTFAEFRAMEGLYGSADGSRWLMKGRTQLGTDLETMLMLGAANAGSVLVQEGQPAVGGGFYDFIGSEAGRFDDFGNAAFSVRARTNQTGVPGVDQHRVLKYTLSSATLSPAFQELDPYTGLSDTTVSGDETVGNSVGSIHLLNDGRIGCQDSTINNIHTSRRPAIFYDRVAFHQTNVTSVNAMGGLGSRLWTTINANTFFTTPDGAHWVAIGDITGGTVLNVLVRDGDVVIQQGEAVPGSVLVAGDIFQAVQSSSGHWMARGRDNSGTTAAAPDWAVLDGALVAQTGQPITPGSGELWGDTLSGVAVDNAGNYVVMGNTSGTSDADAVMVLNGETVVLREGNRVDLNNNGQDDDDAYFGRGNDALTPFSANNVFLAQDGYLYAIINIRNEAGQDLNSTPAFGTPNALVRLCVGAGCAPPACDPDVNCDGAVNGFDVEATEQAVNGDFSNFCQASADLNGDGAENGFDIETEEQRVNGAPC
ncbi:hypothetical protein PHYC_00253 [Phycisphaerales bacterium]|nr:hypothetical protein PHYC_00253 [Phycisphaerales bacterium]